MATTLPQRISRTAYTSTYAMGLLSSFRISAIGPPNDGSLRTRTQTVTQAFHRVKNAFSEPDRGGKPPVVRSRRTPSGGDHRGRFSPKVVPLRREQGRV